MYLNSSEATKPKRHRSLPGFESYVSGIPCRIDVTYYFEQKPLGPTCDSDWDCHGYTEISFDVLDRNGRDAPWLTRKMSLADKERIESEICHQHGAH